MTSQKTQAESEAPAKVYQLDAVDRKVDQALSMLDKIVASVDGVVNNAQLETRMKELAEEFDEKLDEQKKEFKKALENEVKSIHLKYNPTYTGIWWVVGSVATLLLASVWAAFNNFWRGS